MPICCPINNKRAQGEAPSSAAFPLVVAVVVLVSRLPPMVGHGSEVSRRPSLHTHRHGAFGQTPLTVQHTATDRHTHRGTADATSRPDMAPLGLVISLLLAFSWGETLAQAAGMFRRENGTFIATALVTGLAKSQVACASRCTASNSPLCCGFTYHANGTCQMYCAEAGSSCIVSSPEGTQQSGDGSWSRSYRRDIQPGESQQSGDVSWSRSYRREIQSGESQQSGDGSWSRSYRRDIQSGEGSHEFLDHSQIERS